MCKLETLLQSDVTVVTAGEAMGAAASAKTPPSLRRRKRHCSRRQSERDREGGGADHAGRGDRGVGVERDRRENSESLSVRRCPLVGGVKPQRRLSEVRTTELKFFRLHRKKRVLITKNELFPVSSAVKTLRLSSGKTSDMIPTWI